MKVLQRILLSIFLLCTFQSAKALTVGVSGLLYVPYAFSTQKSEDGGQNLFSFQPGVSVNTVFPLWGSTLFVPELGYVMHLGEEDNYNKADLFVLFDFAYRLTSSTLLRYGVGTFMTMISADGGTVVLNNGASTKEYYTPDTTTISYTSTLDLGLESRIFSQSALRLQFFISGITSSDSRQASYMLQYIYYY